MTASEMTTRNELAWLANCYVAGELSVDETAALEARLETDVAACGAVARALELNLAIASAFDVLPSTLSHQPSALAPARWTGAAITALAATAVTAAGVALMVGNSGSTPNGISRKDSAERIVAAWASGEAARNDADDDDLFDAAHEDDLDPPDWMLAALTVEQVKDQLPGNDGIREN